MPAGEGISTRQFDPGAKFGVGPKSFPSGLASVPIKFTFSHGPQTEMKLNLVGGFLGVEQDAELSLCPGH